MVTPNVSCPGFPSFNYLPILSVPVFYQKLEKTTAMAGTAYVSNELQYLTELEKNGFLWYPALLYLHLKMNTDMLIFRFVKTLTRVMAVACPQIDSLIKG